MARWLKRGLIFEPPGSGWLLSHAQNPFPERVGPDRYRVHFAARDQANRARGGWFELDLADPARTLAVSESPSLDLGALGCFDDCGVMPSCLVEVEGVKYLYYTGWTQQVATPFSFFIGLALSRDGGQTYQRYSAAPVLGRNPHDPYLTASPWVLREGARWRMWYVSGTGWQAQPDGKPKHFYHVCYAESGNGIDWESQGQVAIDFQGDEYAIARPVVLPADGGYQMWYCARGGAGSYHAGVAVSGDGLAWERRDAEAGIEPSTDGWDSVMICYPCPFQHAGRHYLLYNGNDYGRGGVGLAELESEGPAKGKRGRTA